ncbi:tRNA dimethylallyltransferase [Acholeplasma morum]|uniref:tRNA (adenosine(37)-N6)-dimethylallyltransferase MiaA n=1 Tax=Paracholeplasma morum TaxID=264637 RepID=UPI00195EFA15|nr:tRNA (adenosine(37)-N6)-dimethylallyltransferase MiaA [Paracholeplasma morum]MBM7453783.1 tRNA dimethylallyltransferase [Paracholeplasma morum]
MRKVVVICGPTAVGKTSLSIELAKKYQAEIISGDSVQVYKGLDIGSAKIKESEKQGVVHHLIDVYEPSDLYDVATFQKEVRKKIDEIEKPFLVGGTGLYIKAALYNYEFDTPKRDIEEEKKYDLLSNDELFEMLVKLDYDASLLIHKNNRRRVLRAIAMANDKKRSSLQQKDEPLYDALILYLTMPREQLYNRINERVDIMVEEGLLDEVNSLKEKGHTFNILGYRELNDYLDGLINYEDAIDLIKQNTRHLAKRQETWFRNQMKALIVDVTNKEDALIKLDEAIKSFYKR